MSFPAIRIEGQIFSGELLQRLDQPDTAGQRPTDFGLPPDGKVKDEIARAWAASQGYYRAFRAKIGNAEASSFTTEARNLWLIPLLSILGYDPDFARKKEEINGKPYAISHRDDDRDGLPMHLLGWNDSLDKRRDDGSGPRMSPHALVQEYLNLTEHLYALVSNGRTLRLLRDSTRLVRQSFIEFDLERMFDEDLFADFAVLFRLLHATRLPTSQATAPASLIERYHQDALDNGARIRDGLSRAVQQAIVGFANGFLSHPDNEALREQFKSGQMTAEIYYKQLLRLIYRFLFLLVTEERRLIFPAGVAGAKRETYYKHYSLQRVRRLAEKPHLLERQHKDLWLGIRATFRLFEADGPGQKLAVAPLAGDLFSPEAIGPIGQCMLDNGTLLECIRCLSLYENRDTRQTMRVNYAALNVEEFGSVYQELLEHEPRCEAGPGGVVFSFVQGDERAATGSHYTPDELVQPLIRHSLDYLIADKLKEKDKEKALLSLRVADISCGSGHILLAAARRIATELAIVRTGEEQPSPTAFRAAVRDVIRECIYGVDLNPLAVDLCKVALWLEAHNPGEPLNFLDHHIKCGNAIVGYAHREEVERGVPDEAFVRLPGDDKETAAELRKRNKSERKDHEKQQIKMDFSSSADKQLSGILDRWREISSLPERNPEEITAKKQRYDAFVSTADAYLLKQILAIPIAQFYLPKTADTRGKLITDAVFREYWTGQRHPQGQATAAAATVGFQKRFFHWFLEFPEIIANGGFDCILGNPPYLGGQALSGTYGHEFCEYVKWKYAPTGLSDLVAFFVRRIHSLLRPGGFTAFITTNSIKDGDVRKDGLEQALKHGGVINMAVRGVKWPGQANLVVSLVSLHKGEWNGRRVLDGQDVAFISAYFEDVGDGGDPKQVPENADKVFQGAIYLGDGFLLTHEAADRLRADDARNADVVFRVINGDEVNNAPDQRPGRSIINFHDWDIGRAAGYSEPFAIVERLVKPVREENNRALYREKWWQYAERRPGLIAEIALLSRCFVAAATTKYLDFSALPTNYVFTHALYVFTTDRWDLYAVVQSTIHEVWARKYSGALETRLRYSPSDCFETYPFPASQWQTPNPALAAIGERYHEHRRGLMLKLWLGLTDIYNLFHTRDLTPEKVAKVSKKPLPEAQAGYEAILELRRLHVQLDLTIRDAYGWTDLDLGHAFHEVETLAENDRVRYTISPVARKELLKRLLALNHQRAAEEEQATRLAPLSSPGKKQKRTKEVGEKAGPPRKHSKGVNFRRGAIASYAVDRLCDRWQFGRTQMEKVLYLAQQEVGIDLEMEFRREAAGPYDVEIHKIESLAAKQDWFTTARRGGDQGVMYARGGQIGDRTGAATSILGEKKPLFDRILDWLAKMDTERAELWATTHAAWNDLILAKEPIDDARIVQEVYSWHRSKARFMEDRILACIKWMRDEGYVPRGLKFDTREQVSQPQGELDLGLDLLGSPSQNQEE